MLYAIKQGLLEKGVAELDIDEFLNLLLAKGLARSGNA
jgi:hypothetical protein